MTLSHPDELHEFTRTRSSEYRSNQPEVRVFTTEAPNAIITRGLGEMEEPFWVGGFAINDPELRLEIRLSVDVLCERGLFGDGSS